MPEGDTVWRSARSLDRALSGHVLTGCDLRVPALADVDLAGQTVHRTLARGKHLLTRIGVHTLHTHLRMEGSWHLHRTPEVASGADRWRRPAHQVRAVLTTDAWQAVGHSLGVVELLPTSAEHEVVGHLGPDLLDADWDAACVSEAVRRLRQRPDRPLVEALLDQRNLAGIGNMYAAELAFLHGRDPLTPVGDVEDLDRLVDRARRVLLVGAQGTSQSTTGSTRRGETHWVYRRDRQACRRCGTRIRVGMRRDADSPERGERASYWCPTCQR
ncbi:Fpg/Nei family DNA glycosylase [Nocardioidaceae bacterium]|nr:Fpg/Nei family DNA glycosylase [Nocardioidaceae bacterium]